MVCLLHPLSAAECIPLVIQSSFRPKLCVQYTCHVESYVVYLLWTTVTPNELMTSEDIANRLFIGCACSQWSGVKQRAYPVYQVYLSRNIVMLNVSVSQSSSVKQSVCLVYSSFGILRVPFLDSVVRAAWCDWEICCVLGWECTPPSPL